MIAYAVTMVLAGQAVSPLSVLPQMRPGGAVGTGALAPIQRRPGPASGAWTDHYMTAARMIKAGRSDEGGVWFYIGQLRGRINVSCVKQDPSGGPAALASLNEMVGTPINKYLGANPDKWAATIQRALDWDAGHADPQNSGAACISARKSQRDGLASLKTYILSHKEDIRRERRKNGLPNS